MYQAIQFSPTDRRTTTVIFIGQLDQKQILQPRKTNWDDDKTFESLEKNITDRENHKLVRIWNNSGKTEEASKFGSISALERGICMLERVAQSAQTP